MTYPCCQHCPFDCVGKVDGHEQRCQRRGCGPYAEPLIRHEMKCGHCGFRITSFRQPCQFCPGMLCRDCAALSWWHPQLDGSGVGPMVWEMP